MTGGQNNCDCDAVDELGTNARVVRISLKKIGVEAHKKLNFVGAI
jgi:hypothetical protein